MRTLSTFVVLCLLAVPARAQQGETAQTPASATNIRLDLSITDTYTGSPIEKTVTMIMQNGEGGMIRTSNILGNLPVELNVDAQASQWARTEWLRVRVTFEYTPVQDEEVGGGPPRNAANLARPAKLHESLTVLLKDGEPMMVSQSADPATDRRVTVELTATVVR